MYLVRHGDAGSGELTADGVRQMKETAQKLKTELCGIETIVIYHSPRLRAVQSAEIIAENLKPINARLEYHDLLDCNCYQLDSVVKQAEQHCIIVGHQPDIKNYLGETIGRYQELNNGQYVKVEINTETWKGRVELK